MSCILGCRCRGDTSPCSDNGRDNANTGNESGLPIFVVPHFGLAGLQEGHMPFALIPAVIAGVC